MGGAERLQLHITAGPEENPTGGFLVKPACDRKKRNGNGLRTIEEVRCPRLSPIAQRTRIVNQPSDAKICSVCFTARPLREFRRQSKAGLLLRCECRRCHAEAERQRRAKATKREFRRFLQRCNAIDPRTNAMMSVFTEVVRRMGGPESVVRRWVEQLQEPRAAATLPVIRAFNGLFNIFVAADNAKRAGETGLVPFQRTKGA